MKTLSILLLLSLTFSCATPSYVLHSRKPSRWWKLFWQPRENNPIPSRDSVALLNDREPWVILEKRMPDGSVWVHYWISIKNSGKSNVSFGHDSFELGSAKTAMTPAVWEKSLAKDPIRPGETLRINARFLLSEATVREFGNSDDPLVLRAKFLGHSPIDHVVWLWKE